MIPLRLCIQGSNGGVNTLQSGIGKIRTDINATIQSLRTVKRKLDQIDGMEAGSQKLQTRILNEEAKLTAVGQAEAKLSQFLDHASTVDRQVAAQVNRNQNEFFNTNPWLRPVEAEEKSWWEKLVEDLKDFVKTAAEKIKETLTKVWEYLKEHAVEIIIGLVAIVIGAILVALSGGTFLAALVAGLKAAAITAVISGLMSGTFALFQGESFWEGFGDGLANGFMWGGIGFGFSHFTGWFTKTTGLFKRNVDFSKSNNFLFGNSELTVWRHGNKFRIDIDVLKGIHYHMKTAKHGMSYHRKEFTRVIYGIVIGIKNMFSGGKD